MKLFKIWCDKFEYDTYDGIIIVAESEQQAWKCLDDEQWMLEHFNRCFFNFAETPTVEEIKLDEINEPTVLLTSFNAG